MAIFALQEHKTDEKLTRVINMLMQEGLTKYKTKHSKAALPMRVEATKADMLHKKGAVFAVRDKSHFIWRRERVYHHVERNINRAS